METALTVVQTPSEQQFTGQLFDLAKNTEDDTVKLIAALLSSPVVAMVAAAAIIEALQGVEVYKGNKELQTLGPYPTPGSDYPHYETSWVKKKEPLISQGLATTLETVIITSETFKNIGGGDLAKLLAGLFIK